VRNFLAVSAATLIAIAAQPASAQTASGQVDITGFVSPRCGSTYAGSPTFNGEMQLGELAQSNGQLQSVLATSTTASPAAEVHFAIGCSAAAKTVTFSASRLSNPLAAPFSTFSNDIDYTAEIKIALAEGGFLTADYRTAASAPAATVLSTSQIFANQLDNFGVRIFALEPETAPTNLLVAGNYTGAITITVSPN
jgi:hypothetical protein